MHRTLMFLWPAVATVAGVVAMLVFAQATPVLEHAMAQEPTSIGIDVNPEGSSATLLGPREVCLEVHSGDTFLVDVTVQNISQLSAWETYLTFDPAVVSVADRDVQLLLASTPNGNVFDLSESVPDDDGRYRIGGASISDPPESVDGSGVLARLTLEAQSSGSTDLSVGAFQTDAGEVGPTLTDVDGNQIGDEDDDGLFDSPALDARVAVDESCPNDGGLVAALTSSDGGGLAWWLLVAVPLAIVVTAGFGGLALIALRRPGSPRAS